jgi:signal transduction histidine kinase
VTIEPDGVGRYGQDVESAVYFSCLEALNNVAKYADASAVSVRLTQDDRWLRFEVEDDGRGFEVSARSYGTGLQGIADRVDALGGRFEVRSRPGAGTTLAGSIPVAASRG